MKLQPTKSIIRIKVCMNEFLLKLIVFSFSVGIKQTYTIWYYLTSIVKFSMTNKEKIQ